MSILEKLRPQPRWKHSDPAVRASAIYELGPDDLDVLRALARDDREARVRRAAVSRLDDVALLGEIAGTDPDEDVRAEAVRGLAGLGAESTDAERIADIVRRLLAIGRSREVVAIARDGATAEVRAAVVDLLDDQKALGAVSRHALDGATRLRALARVSDPETIVAVAAKSEHTDVAVAALERVEDQEQVLSISQRARNKVAARRARVRVRAIEDAAKAVVPDAPASMPEADRARAHELVVRAEALVAMADPVEAATGLSEVRLAWAELHADVEIDDDLVRQFETAGDAVREAVAEREREQAAEGERARAMAIAQADRVAITSDIEQLAGPGSEDAIAELKVRWDALPPMPTEYAASLTRRFQDACRAYEERERRRRLGEAAVARLDSVATEAEQLAASEQPLEDVVNRWRGLRRDADVLREYAASNPEAAGRLDRAVVVLEAREEEYQALRARQEQDNLRRLQQLCRQLETLAAADTITLKAGDKALRDIRTALDERAPLPSKQERQDIQSRLEAARTALAPRVQELRDADDWQRWANLQVQEELCRDMEALQAEPDLELAGKRMRELQARWKQVALAPRAQGEAMWRRFKLAQDEVFTRTAAFFAAQAEERTANLAAKQALCARAEALAESRDWVKTAAEIQALQAEWKTLGPVSRGHEKAVWERFRGACDRFFSRRNEDLKRRKDEWSVNLAKKEALCEEAETLAESTEWEAAIARVKQLQGEWKAVGPVRRAKSEVVWQRFRTACDRLFERYKLRDQIGLQDKLAVHLGVIEALEGLGATDGPDAPDGLYASTQEARARWQQAPEVPRAALQDVTSRYQAALAALVVRWPAAFAGTDLDPDTTRKRMEKLLARVEELTRGEDVAAEADLSPTERLARQLRERLATNTITGRANEADQVRSRAAEQEVRSAQAQWSRLGPVAPDVAGPLGERFQRACRKFFEQHRRRVS
ncbi:MAG: DUF349 domain-containing protein [Vicinamibacterales bacterium]